MKTKHHHKLNLKKNKFHKSYVQCENTKWLETWGAYYSDTPDVLLKLDWNYVLLKSRESH